MMRNSPLKAVGQIMNKFYPILGEISKLYLEVKSSPELNSLARSLEVGFPLVQS